MSVESEYERYAAAAREAEEAGQEAPPEVRFALVMVAYPADSRPTRATITGESAEWAYVRSGLDRAGAEAVRDAAEEQPIQPFTEAEEVAAAEEA